MTDFIASTLQIASSGLRAQSARMRIISENLANAHSVAPAAGGDPYQRKTISFTQVYEDTAGAALVRVADVGRDMTPFPSEHRPGDPAADEAGMVKLPNVNPLIEAADMREANRSYQANLQVVKQARQLSANLLDILRGR